MAKHKQATRDDGGTVYFELPKKQHDSLVCEYWKTWLSAWQIKVESKEAMQEFVARMENMLLSYMESGAMFDQEGLVDD